MLALLGIVHRQIRTKRPPDNGPTLHRRPFPTEIRTLGDFLRKARIDQRLNQRQMAAKLQVTRRTIQMWEQDIEIPEADEWPTLACWALKRVASASVRDRVSTRSVVFAPDYGSENTNEI